MAFIAFEMHLLPSTYNSASNAIWFVICRDLVSNLFKPNAFIIAGAAIVYCSIPVMMTSSNGTIFRVTGPLCGEFTGPGEFPAQRPMTRSFDVFFDLRLDGRLGKHSWGWWLEKPSCPLWRQSDVSWVPCSQQRRCARKTGLRSQGSLAKFLDSL